MASSPSPATMHHPFASRRMSRFVSLGQADMQWAQPVFRPKGVLFIAMNVALLAMSLALDVRDLYYKTKWIGLFDSYAFDGVGEHVLDKLALVPSTPGNVSGQVLPRASGWSSFLEPCDAMMGSAFFLSSLGVNCTVGGARGDPHARVVPRLVMTSTIRADSVAWACCQLLHYNKRPGLCHRRIAARFLKKYAMQAPKIPRAAMARPGSPAERELLHMLGVLERSSRVSRAVCVEAFELRELGFYRPTIFGCGSADLYAAAFAGEHATHIRQLLEDKAWLTVDELNVMRMRYVVRQNDRSDYTVRVSDGLTVATHHPLMNYSSSGHLYPIMLGCDLLIFIAQVLSSIQIVRVLLLPQLRFNLGYRKKPVSFFRGSTWLSLVSRSLVRSGLVAVLTVISQLISWQLIMPNAVIWGWTEKNAGRWLALLSSMRVWELILVSSVWLWEALVALIGERAAYAFTSRTYISLPEIAAISALIGLLRRKDLLSVTDNKYAYDGQRLTDRTSFVGAAGYANTYNTDYDRVRSSDARYWVVVYGPLARLVVVSLAGFTTLVLLKMVYYWPQKRLPSNIDRLDSVRLLPYERLPVEKLLNEPIRAKSLMRFRFDMELAATAQTPVRYVYAPLYFAFGSLVDADGQLLRRQGFMRAIPPCIDLATGISVSDSVALTGSTLLHAQPLGAPRRMPSALNLGVRPTMVRFVGQHAASEPPRRWTRVGGDGTDTQWLSERWTGQRHSFTVPIH